MKIYVSFSIFKILIFCNIYSEYLDFLKSCRELGSFSWMNVNTTSLSLLDCDDLATGNPDAVRILLIIILGGGACLIGYLHNVILKNYIL